MIYKLMEEIQKEGKFFSQAKDGKAFEDKFMNLLKSNAYSQIRQISKTESAIEEISKYEKITKEKSRTIYKGLKKSILSKNSLETIKNPYKNIRETFIFEPYGSQNFPDFLIFTNNWVIPIEIKYSKNKKKNTTLNSFRPTWNSNLPKPKGIYIYGVASEDVTFFKGADVLDYETRQSLIDYFEKVDNNANKKYKKILDQKLENLKNDFGLYPYIRKAYEHKKEKSTHTNEKNQKTIESYFSKNRQKRENNVINFLKELESD